MMTVIIIIIIIPSSHSINAIGPAHLVCIHCTVHALMLDAASVALMNTQCAQLMAVMGADAHIWMDVYRQPGKVATLLQLSEGCGNRIGGQCQPAKLSKHLPERLLASCFTC
jgi:hypothetical protein